MASQDMKSSSRLSLVNSEPKLPNAASALAVGVESTAIQTQRGLGALQGQSNSPLQNMTMYFESISLSA